VVPAADAENRTPVAPDPRLRVVPVIAVSICGEQIRRRPESIVPEKFDAFPLGCCSDPVANGVYVRIDSSVPAVTTSKSARARNFHAVFVVSETAVSPTVM